MSRKDYKAIAGALYAIRNQQSMSSDVHVVDTCIRKLATVMSDDNPRFDTERFCVAAMTGKGI
jgi:hypothetical protein